MPLDTIAPVHEVSKRNLENLPGYVVTRGELQMHTRSTPHRIRRLSPTYLYALVFSDSSASS